MLFSKRLVTKIAVTAIVVITLFSTPEALETGATPLQSLYMMKQLVPKAQTIGIMWNQSEVNTSSLLPQIERGSASVGLKVVVEDVEHMSDISQKYRDLVENYHIQVLWIIQDDNILGSSLGKDFLIKNCTVTGVTLFAPSTDWVSSGACAALMNEGGSVKLFVNQKTLNALGLKVPQQYIPTTQFLASN